MPIAIQNKKTKKYMVGENGKACWGYVTADSFQFDSKVYEAVECEVPPYGDQLEDPPKSLVKQIQEFYDAQTVEDRVSLIQSGYQDILAAAKVGDLEVAQTLATGALLKKIQDNFK